MNKSYEAGTEPPFDAIGRRTVGAISRGFEELLFEQQLPLKDGGTHFDVVIVGSGYGGAVAAAELSGYTAEDGDGNGLVAPRCGSFSVCVLERGAEYLPGSFPSRFSEVAGHVRFSTPNASRPQGRREGLFDVRLGEDVNALVANGLGGGSLINAGVMAEPDGRVFTNERWPAEFRQKSTREYWYGKARALLGAAANNTISSHEAGPGAKFDVLAKLEKGGSRSAAVFAAAPLSMVMSRPAGGPEDFGFCNRCGDCATGCNHGAKNSLDANLLARAKRRGAHLFAGATVLRIVRDDLAKGWCLEVVHTDEKLRKRQGEPFKLMARKVILAAGTFGSTEILLRSNNPVLPFSSRVGQRFSSNGDTIAALYGHAPEANAIVDEATFPDTRSIGPTITGMLTAQSGRDREIVIEELAIPGSLKRLCEELVTTAHTLHTLDEEDARDHDPSDTDPCAVNENAMKRTSFFALMGDDGAKGAIELVGGDEENEGDGAVRVRWPELRTHPLFEDQLELLKELAQESGVGGRVLPNPLWRFVPKSMEDLFGGKLGPVFTVHPLGGCAMGPDWRDGVVDEFGRVYKARVGKADDSSEEREHKALAEKAPEGSREREHNPIWHSLAVVDGSIVPTALGTNPGLTIAALALHSVAKLCEDWKWPKVRGAEAAAVERPVYRKPVVRPRTPETGTRFELIERLHGFAMLQTKTGPESCAIELTLRFRPFPITHITGCRKTPLELDSETSQVRIFREKDWRRARRLGQSDDELSKLVRITMRLEGTLTVLRRETSSARPRRWTAFKAWLANRGVRDSRQWLMALVRGTGTPPETRCTAEHGRIRFWLCQRREQLGRLRDAVCKKFRNALALASHAGEARLFEYDLKTVGKPTLSPDRRLDIPEFEPGAAFTGFKRLTYRRRSNPWRQLQELTLTSYPGRLRDAEPPVLDLDTRYLGEQGVPLIRVAKQDDQPSALADVVSLGAYLLRLMVTVHVWSFRMPDTPDAREPQRLPAPIPGPWWRFWNRCDQPRITEIQVDELPDGTPVRVRLSKYVRGHSIGPPVVMIHGYSASGTTFAHPAVNPNLAAYFLARKREVWILDLRTSSGMPTARMPWTFEDAALVDIPAALGHIVRETRERRGDASKIDVIAHCMGSAMFSMAVLSWPEPGVEFYREREQLPSWVNRAVLSQVGPLVEFSPENVLRGYVLSYLRHFLPLERYEFRTGPDPSLTDQFIDRVLATLPYPEHEFDFENPPWWQFWRDTPWVGTRHRMDALYARDFSVRNVPRKVLAHIDDLFGPLNVETVSQGIHFARHKVITNRSGRNVYVTRRQLKDRWDFDTLSVHGDENGLSDVATLAHMSRGFRQAGVDKLRTKTFERFGHQDSLIGRDAGKVFAEMAAFLERKVEVARGSARRPNPVSARVPWIGPHRAPSDPGEPASVRIRAAMDPGPNQARFAAFLPVTEQAGRFALRANPYGDPDLSLVQLRHVPHDRDGWMRVDLKFSRAWLGETDAILMLLLYDEPDRIESALMSEEFSAVRAALRQVQFPAGLADPRQELDCRKLFQDKPELYDRLVSTGQIEKVREYVDFMLKPVQQALRDALTDKTAEELRPALLEINKPQGSVQPALCFAFGSCQYPAGLLDGEVADRSMALLSRRLDDTSRPRPEFLLLLGDQVYVDATAGLFDPTALDDRYVRNYERLYLRKNLQNVLRRLPSYMMLDDHEIDDNWEPGVDDVRVDRNLIEARRSYWRYQRFENFGKWDRERDACLSFDFEHAEVPFFVADTRTHRTTRTAGTLATATIMTDADFMRLTNWLDRWKAKPEVPKFVASPAILLPRHLRPHGSGGALRCDGWEGYPRSFHALLAHIAIERIENVFFLSGDEHLSCIATAQLRLNDEPPVVVHSIHSSALYAPYPFANSDVADFPVRDFFTFKYDDMRSVSCDVTTEFATPGDGFAILRWQQGTGKVWCEFVRDGPGCEIAIPPGATIWNRQGAPARPERVE